MPLPRRFLSGLLISLLTLSAGCGKREEPTVLTEPSINNEGLAPAVKPADETVGPNQKTLDLRVAGIWAKIDVPDRTTLTSMGRDECFIKCGASFLIRVTRLAESPEAVKTRLTEENWKFVEQTDSGFVAEIELPEPARIIWRNFNPYPAGYLVSVVPSSKLTAGQRSRMLESIATFRPVAVSVEEMTRSQQAMRDLRQAGAAIIARPGGLEVDFPWRSDTEKLLPRVSELNRVASLCVHGSGAFSGTHLKTVASCPGLTSLCLRDLSINEADWNGLDGNPSLQEIRVEQAPHRPQTTPASSKKILNKLGQLPAMRGVVFRRHGCDASVLKEANQLAKSRLSMIGFEDAGLTSSDVKILAEHPGWKGLSLADNPLTTEIFGTLREMRQLESLDLSGCRINDRSLANLGDLPLTRLTVSRTDLTDAGIAALPTIFPRLLALDISGTAGTDACLASVIKLVKLRELSLAHLAFKNPALDQLAGCGDLRSFNVANTSFKASDLPKLLESLNRLEVVDFRATAVDVETADKITKVRPECNLLLEGTPAHDGKRADWVLPAPTPVTVPVPLDQLPPANPPDLLKKFDGKALVDEDIETKPVVEITLSTVELADTDLAELRELKNLQRLRLDGCEKITEAGLAYLKDLPALRELYLSRTAVTANVSGVLGQFKNLVILELPDVKMSQKNLGQLEGLKNLEVIRGALAPDHPEAFVDFLSKCRKLRLFDWPAVEWNNRRLIKLKELNALESVELRGNWVSDAGLEVVAGFPKLRELTIHDELISDAGLKTLDKLTGLRKLSLEGRRFSDGVLIPFRNNTELESLRLACPGFSDRGAVPLRSFQKLLELDLHGNVIGDATAQHLAESKELEWIDFGDTKLTDQGLKYLKGLDELRKLTLSRTGITGEGFSAISALSRLSRLELEHTKMTKKGLEGISKISSIEEIDLSHVQATDEAILALRALPGLKRLRLDGNIVMTDRVADGLVLFPQLTEVSVIGTKLTGKGLAVLRKKDGLTVLTE